MKNIYIKNKYKGFARTIIVVLSILLTFMSCNDSQHETEVIQIEGAEMLTLSTDEILNCLNLTRLETSPMSLIGDDFEVLDHIDDGFYIFDKGSSEEVVKFNGKGEFITRIGRKGRGAGEYHHIYDAMVTDIGVELLCGFPSTEVFYYDKDGVFLSKKEMLASSLSYAFIIHPQLDKYFFYSPTSSHKIIGVSESSGIAVDSLLPVVFGSDMVFQLHPFSKQMNGNVLFFESLSNIIYEITVSGLSEKYNLDFGTLSLDPGINMENFMKHYQSRGFWEIHKVLENSQLLYIAATKNLPNDTSPFYHLIYDIKNKRIYRLSENDAFASALKPAFHFNNQNELYFALAPIDALDSREWVNFFRSYDFSIQEDSNPLIIRLLVDNSILK